MVNSYNDRMTTLTKPEKKARIKRRILRILLLIIGVLIVIRAVLPSVILKLINKKLETLPTYTCIVQDFSLSFTNQSITLKGIKMTKKNGKIDLPFFISGDIHVSLESYQKKTSKIVVETCKLNLIKGKNEALSQLTIDEELIEIFKQMPLKPNIFILKHADIHFIENYRSPNIALAIKNIIIDGRNLENESNSKAKYPAILTINGEFEGGKLNVVAKLNKQKEKPMVNLVSSLSSVDISNVKNFLKVYADLDVISGTLNATSIIHVQEGRIDGFIDPTVRNLAFQKTYDKTQTPLGKRIKQRLLNSTSKLLGKDEDQKIKTRIEFHGTIEEVHVDVWKIITEGLKNSFLVGTLKKG